NCRNALFLSTEDYKYVEKRALHLTKNHCRPPFGNFYQYNTNFTQLSGITTFHSIILLFN
ncbi:hypothetical protein, partial [Parabacteroides goldsteinii]|uniref:hypothetical protein n=1 Tax=Parabacteroides goldsteinii TaxID=328812 RepID=UPI0025AE0325